MEMLTTPTDTDPEWIEYGAGFTDACQVGDGVMLVVSEYRYTVEEPEYAVYVGKAARAFRWTPSGPEAGPVFTAATTDASDPHQNPPLSLNQISDGLAWETFYAPSSIDDLMPLGCEWVVDLDDLTVTRGSAQSWATPEGVWNAQDIVTCSSPGRATMVVEVQWSTKDTSEMFVWDGAALTHTTLADPAVPGISSPWNPRSGLGHLLDDGANLYRIGYSTTDLPGTTGWPGLGVYQYSYSPGANSVSGAGTLVGEFTTVVNGDEGVYSGAVYACFVGADHIDVAVPASYTTTWQPWYAGRIHKTTGDNSGLIAGDLFNDEFYGYRQEYVQIIPWSDTESFVTALGSEPDTDGVGYYDPQGSAGRVFDGTALGEQVAVMPFFFGEDDYSEALEAVAVGPGKVFTVFSGGWWTGKGTVENPAIDMQVWVSQIGAVTTDVHLRWWDGAELQPATLVGWWDGTTVQPATLDSWWIGS
jgi:hypothetical protein